MPSIPILQIDAFTNRPFSGNPAAVCLLQDERDDAWMQAIAAEMNLSETAFVRPRADGFALRWFTPLAEVDLCGHATLAAAHALWTTGAVHTGERIRFHTKSGRLVAQQSDELIELDFPTLSVVECAPPPGLLEALNVIPTFVGRTRFDLLLLLEDAAAVRNLRPDVRRLASAPVRGVIVTAAPDVPEVDFVSRFFAPSVGIDEDPVTGSAHCSLGPFWSGRLGKQRVTGYQASRRGGTVHVTCRGERVTLAGAAVTVMTGQLE
jgi:predicted PhzF superfamily epimerase YddE/YHI9